MLSPPQGQVKCSSPTVVIIVQCPDNMVMWSWGRHYQSDHSWNTALTVRWLIIWTSRVQCWIQCCAICSRHIDTSTLHTHTYCLSPRTWVSNTGTGILAGYIIASGRTKLVLDCWRKRCRICRIEIFESDDDGCDRCCGLRTLACGPWHGGKGGHTGHLVTGTMMPHE